MRTNQQKSRSRSRSSSSNSNSRRNTNPLSRSYESNGPDIRVRGNAALVAEKYVQLARDADMSGDSVAAENYLQHAEHYFRIISAAQAQVQTQQLAQQAAHQSQQAAQQARQAELKAAQSQNTSDINQGSAPSETETNPAPVQEKQLQPESETEGEPGTVNEAAPSPASGEEEATPRPVRRPRRRPRTADKAETAKASGVVSKADPAGAPQPETGELPSFVTTGGKSDAAE